MNDNNDMTLYIFAASFIVFILIALCTDDKYDNYGRPARQFRLSQDQYKRYMGPTVTRLT